MAGKGGTGSEHLGHPQVLQDRDVGGRDDPAHQYQHIAPALFLQALHHPGDERQVGPGEQRQADGVGILLHHGLDHLFRRLMESGVDDLEPGIPQGPGDHLRPAVVAVQSRFGHYHSVWAFHGGRY